MTRVYRESTRAWRSSIFGSIIEGLSPSGGSVVQSASDYSGGVGCGPLDVVVHHDVIEPGCVAHLVLGGSQPTCQVRFTLRVPGPKAPFEFIDRRRLEEDQYGIRKPRPNGGRPLNVDLEQHVVPSLQLRVDGSEQRAVPLAEDLRPLEERALLDQPPKPLRGHEPVVAALDLPEARVAGRAGDGEHEIRTEGQERPNDRGLAGTRRPGENEQAPRIRPSGCQRATSWRTPTGARPSVWRPTRARGGSQRCLAAP